tara:strand:+ start:1398 stop:2930 length:1533 start_codon:yes stop_codon:yes gene_type:complete
MSNFKILDCTIRDGGYYNNWDFSNQFTKNYLRTISKINIDYVEIGFRKPLEKKNQKSKKFGQFLITTENTLKNLNIPSNFKLAVMINLSDYLGKNLKDRINNNFINSKESKISVVRIACTENDLNNLSEVTKILKSKGYNFTVNLMQFTTLPINRISFFLNSCLKLGADYAYIADSFGNCTPKKIKLISNHLKRNKVQLKKIGFHAHDNTGQALKNSLTAIQNGFGIIDTSIMGMGRGAGNLNLGDFLNFHGLKKEKKIVETFSNKFMKKLMKLYKWGKNDFYNFSAQNNIHPTFVQRMLDDKKFKKSYIIKIMNFLKSCNATKYDMNIFDDLFLKVKKFNPDKNNFNSKNLVIFCDNKKIKRINLNKIKNDKNMLTTLNYSNFINYKFIDYIFLSNSYRVFTEIKKILTIKKIKIIIPNYDLLKNIFKKRTRKFIFFNIEKKNRFNVLNSKCYFKKNLVLAYSLAFGISKRFKTITIHGLTKDLNNEKIINEVKRYLKSNSYKTKIMIK